MELKDRLAQTDEPLPSMVLRRPRAIDLPFLPNPEEKLTDAQRLGKLLLAKADDSLTPEQKQQVEQEYRRQQELYSFYASAEAFNVPLHNALGFYNPGITSKDIFGVQEAKLIQQAQKDHLLIERIPPVLQKIRLAQQEISLESNSFPTPRAYVQMLQLEEKFAFYKNQLDSHNLSEYLGQKVRREK